MTCRVLLVEDDTLQARLLTDRLNFLGFDVVGPIQSTVDALQILKQHPVDTAILDYQLQGETVMPVASELDRLGIWFVLYTGVDRRRLASSLTRNFFYLSKFDSPKHLELTLDRAIKANNDSSEPY